MVIILPISHKLNFTPYTLGCYGLKEGDLNARTHSKCMLDGRLLERTELNLIHFKWGSRANRHSLKLKIKSRIFVLNS